MTDTVDYITALEWANYAATAPVAQVTPGLELTLREDIVITSSTVFPTPDANHACLLRTDRASVEALLDEASAYFDAHGLPTTVFLSPACTPDDLPTRLAARGFRALEEREAWMVFEDLLATELPAPGRGVTVRLIRPQEALTFARVFLRAFEMPLAFAPAMADVLAPSIALPNVRHYLALTGDNEPIGTCSLICHQQFGILGSAGVLPTVRGGRAAHNLVVRAFADAQDQGVDTVMLQTTADTRLERFLRISGFERIFIRTGYLRE